MSGSAIIGQSGGPTAVINASLVGAVHAAMETEPVDRVLGMRFGIRGLIEGNVVDLSGLPARHLAALADTPSSALGSTRYKLRDEDLPTVLARLQEHDVRYFFLIGGNDTMDTADRVGRYCDENGWELHAVGIPKTVDNDLYGTDHTPGFPSAARDVALSVQQAGRLARDMRRVDQYAVFQTIGRDAGWLAAAAALTRHKEADAPHLVYVPEVPMSRKRFLTEVRTCIEHFGYAYIVCGEGVVWEDGTPVSASNAADAFSNIEFGAMGGASAAFTLHRLIADQTGYRGEFQIPESLPMCAADRVSDLDRREAYACGRHAIETARNGYSGVMVTIRRTADTPYASEMDTEPLAEVARRTHHLPERYYDPESRQPTEAFRQYARPLVGELSPYTTLDEVSSIAERRHS